MLIQPLPAAFPPVLTWHTFLFTLDQLVALHRYRQHAVGALPFPGGVQTVLFSREYWYLPSCCIFSVYPSGFCLRSLFFCFVLPDQLNTSYDSIFSLFISGTWELLDWGSNSSCSCQPTPQLWQHQIQATSSTYPATHSRAGSLTQWARPGIEPASSWVLVGLITTESQQQLPLLAF